MRLSVDGGKAFVDTCEFLGNFNGEMSKQTKRRPWKCLLNVSLQGFEHSNGFRILGILECDK